MWFLRRVQHAPEDFILAFFVFRFIGFGIFAMASKEIDDQINLYAAIMREIKFRIEAIDLACKGGLGIQPPLVSEFCYLQLRFICEIIAISCLVAHGDIRAKHTKKFAKEWSADRILGLLEKLRPDFYPSPVKYTEVKPGHHLFEIIPDGFMTKPELIRLYHKCGDALHRGSVKKLLIDGAPIRVSYPEIMKHVNKIAALLRIHRVMLLDGKQSIICTLHQKDTGDVQVAFGQAIESQ